MVFDPYQTGQAMVEELAGNGIDAEAVPAVNRGDDELNGPGSQRTAPLTIRVKSAKWSLKVQVI